ncbi:MAG: hypothetical protein FJ217_00680 [Ignavibacteria bacterium]|nr:hypothetical protein [Ignavibacteria bacterium]
MLNLLAVFLVGYLIGSIPAGYLVVKKKHHVDVLREGSGKGGGFNAYSVTGSKATGVLVGILDALKGFVAVYGVGQAFSGEFSSQAVALFGAIAGHNYPIWLRFKGGRGLSTTAGGLLLLGFSYAIVWCTVWLVGRLLRRDILTSNLISIFLTPAILWIIPWSWVDTFIAVQTESGMFLFFVCILSILLLLAHYDVVSAVWKQSKTG